MAVRPVINAGDQVAGARTAQTFGQRQAFVESEVPQLDPAPDVKRAGARIGDQVGGCRRTDQADGQSFHCRVLRAAVVRLAEGGKELVCREGSTLDGVDLIDEYHDWRLDAQLLDRSEES